ncbi:hypothetical protein EC973_006935, partial [Apophysomyces ossiformis]
MPDLNYINFPSEATQEFYKLDVSHNLTRNELASNWTQLQSNIDPNPVVECNADFAMVNVPQAFLINGGVGFGAASWDPISGTLTTTLLVNETTKFDGQKWSTLPSGGTQQ